MSLKLSHILYKDIKGNHQILVLPTIQSVTIPDSNTIPSHPTITGQYRQQYTVSKAPKASFTILLEDGRYAGETLDTSDVLDTLEYLKKNKIKFNLTTSHTGEESRFLTDLAIESINYSRRASKRKRLTATINCTQLKMVELEWEMKNSVDIFGYNIFADVGNSTKIQPVSFVPAIADEEFTFDQSRSEGIIDLAKRFLAQDPRRPVVEHVGEYIDEYLPDARKSVVFKLANHLDISAGDKTYRGTARFKSQYNSDAPYECKLIEDLDFEVKTSPGKSLQPEIPVGLVVMGEGGSIPTDTLLAKNNQHFVYDFANTYPTFSPSKSFEYVAHLQELCDFMDKTEPPFVRDRKMVNGNCVMRDDNDIYVYPIESSYICTMRFGDKFEVPVVFDGGFGIVHHKITTNGHDFKIQASDDDLQKEWDHAYKTASGTEPYYEMHIVIVTLGTMFQIYLVAPSILKKGMIL